MSCFKQAVGVVRETFACELRGDHRGHECREVTQVGFSYRGSEHAEQGAGVDEQQAFASLDPQQVQIPVPVVWGRVTEGRACWELVEDLPGAADEHVVEGSRGGSVGRRGDEALVEASGRISDRRGRAWRCEALWLVADVCKASGLRGLSCWFPAAPRGV